ncbi:hypothetical protein OHB12_14695 [Nocardia sp. NBC_01730]|uniref:hypothetical protein n=1 Tax=Nocardia sp. NBC_01730 TaxID=2975998 RepID=UPI002E0FC1F6|nr:hypothetical protein OHB12_14695 [Nocardia sp. NBC_01730]
MRGKVPLRVQILAALSTEPDWDSITPDQVAELREAQNRKRRSVLGGLATGRPDRGARITTHALDLPGRRLDVRVYQPERGGSAMPLIVAFHGGGFIGGAPAGAPVHDETDEDRRAMTTIDVAESREQSPPSSDADSAAGQSVTGLLRPHLGSFAAVVILQVIGAFPSAACRRTASCPAPALRMAVILG